jgi:ferritin
MLGTKMEEAINLQINREMYSAYLYLSMSFKATALGCKGSGKWLMVQYHEEMVHAMKFCEYVADQNGRVVLTPIAGQTFEFPSLLDIYTKVLSHEQSVTASINALMNLAVEESDHATQALLSWYITEQVEEEKNAGEIVRTLAMIGENPTALFLYDKELGLRTVTVPTDFSLGVTAAMKGA